MNQSFFGKLAARTAISLALILSFSANICAQTTAINPDQRYPIPNNYGDSLSSNVNLFTGDINFYYPLASIGGQYLRYDLELMYNSRSVALTPFFTGNTVGGLGWKLMDYPKIAYDQTKKQYFFLDGNQAIPLIFSDSSAQAQTASYLSNGDAWMYQFTQTKISGKMNQCGWKIKAPNGTVYQFNTSPGTLDGKTPGRLWNLTLMVDAQKVDTLKFGYDSEGKLFSITNNADASIQLEYLYGKLIKVASYSVYNSAGNRLSLGEHHLAYTGNFPPDTSLHPISSITLLKNVQQTMDAEPALYPVEAPTNFYYQDPVYPGALNQILTPQGGKRVFLYDKQTISGGNNPFYPVKTVRDYSGNLVDYQENTIDQTEPVGMQYEGVKSSPDGYYAWSNLTTLTPGNDVQDTLFTDLTTSFDKGSPDVLFPNMGSTSGSISTAYALSGTSSFYLYAPSYETYLISKRLGISRKKESTITEIYNIYSGVTSWGGSVDSVEISFYALNYVSGASVIVKPAIFFYDKNNKSVSETTDQQTVIDSKQYGKWTRVACRFAIPPNAVSFNFKIGGGGNYDKNCYIDNVSVSGAVCQIQGAERFYFFNGDTLGNLRHLPDAYRQNYSNTTPLAVYYTGFETGQQYDKWLEIDSDCKAKVKLNSPDRMVAYNGNAALHMHACDDGSLSEINTKNINFPSGTKSVLVSFYYSSPQVSGLTFSVQGSFKGASNSSVVQMAPGGSYYIDPGYLYYEQEFAIPSGAQSFSVTIKVDGSGSTMKVNDFFLDDLNVVFLNKDVKKGNLAVNVADSLLYGFSYFYAMQTANNTVRRSNINYFKPSTSQTGARYVQLKETNGSFRASPGSGTEVDFNSIGLPEAATTLWVRTNEDSTQTFIYTKEHFKYAFELWPNMGPSKLNDLENLAATYTTVSSDKKKTWNIIDAEVTQWKPFNTFWAPWRTFILKDTITQSELNQVMSNLPDTTYTPPYAHWSLSSQTLSRLPSGVANVVLSGDSIVTTDQYGLSSVSLRDGLTVKRYPPVVAEFSQAGPGNCFFMGFESYESLSTINGIKRDTAYAHTGAYGAYTLSNVSFDFNAAGANGNSYVFGFYAMPDDYCKTFHLTIVNSSGVSVLDYSFPVSSSQVSKWTYFETVFQMPVYTGTLKFTIVPVTKMQNEIAQVVYDDIRFSPANAVMNASVYDITTYRTVATIDNNAQTELSLYDRFGNVACVLGQEQRASGIQMVYSSRMNPANKGIFRQNDPNAITTFTPKGASIFYTGDNSTYSKENWEYFHNNAFAVSNSQSIFVRAGGYAQMPRPLPDNKSDFGFTFKLITTADTAQNASSQRFGIDLGSVGIAFSLNNTQTIDSLFAWVKVDASNWGQYGNPQPLPYTIQKNLGLDCAIICQGSKLYCWVNGRLLVSGYPYNASSFSQLHFFADAGSLVQVVQVANVVYSEDMIVNADYFDGKNQVIQNQSLVETGLIVNEILYDRMSLPVLTTNKVLIAGASPGFRTGFVSAFDWTTGFMSGEVNQDSAYVIDKPDDNGYFYSRRVYERAPEPKISNQFNPGYDFALRNQTGWERAKYWAYTHEDEIITGLGYAFDAVDIICNPEEAPIIIGMDLAQAAASYAADKVMAHYSKTTDNEENEYAITNYYYDERQNLVKTKLPNANSSKKPKKSQVVQAQFDFSNQIVHETTPESGNTNWAYNRKGMIRFFANENDLDGGQVRYFKYDKLGRPIEAGTFDMAWNQASLENAANIPDYPGTSKGHIVFKSMQYDGNGVQNCYAPNRGLVTSLSVTNEAGASSTSTYSYDDYARIATVSLSIKERSGTVTDYTTNYAYDNLDNITNITYPAWSGQSFNVGYSWNKSNNIAQVFTPESTTIPFAQIQYNPDGQPALNTISALSGKQVTICYDYNPAGWPVIIHAGTSTSTSNKDNYFRIDYGYNFLQDWWSKLWGQAYYNGDIACSTISPGSKCTAKQVEHGYNYNDYGAVDQYYNNLKLNEHIPGSEKTYYGRKFDLNGNLKRDKATKDGFFTDDKTGYVAEYNSSTNQPKFYKYYTDLVSSDSKYILDTMFFRYDLAGNLSKMQFYAYAPASSGSNGNKPQLLTTVTRTIELDDWERCMETIVSRPKSVDTTTWLSYGATDERIMKEVIKYPDASPYIKTVYIRGTGSAPLMEIVHENGSDYARYYIQGPDGILGYYKNTVSTTSSWVVLPDVQSSTIALVNRDTRNMDAYYSYDDYGMLLIPEVQNRQAINYLFTGQEYDHETDLYNFKARLYDPWSKLFLSPDPAGQHPATPYAYCSNDAVNRIDPDGKVNFNLRALTQAEELEARTEFAGQTLIEIALGKTVNGVREKPSWTLQRKWAFKERFNGPNGRADLDAFFVKVKHSTRNQMVYTKDHESLMNILRPGGSHEMLMVSKVRTLRDRGFTLEDMQSYSIATQNTSFRRFNKRKNKWGLTRYKHANGMTGSKYSSRAHQEIETIINGGPDKSTTLSRLKLWSTGDLPGFKYRLSKTSYGYLPLKWQ